MREIKICTCFKGDVMAASIKRAWTQSQEIWVTLAGPLYFQMTLGPVLPCVQGPSCHWNKGMDSATCSYRLLLHFMCCVCCCGSSHLVLIHGFLETRMHSFQIQHLRTSITLTLSHDISIKITWFWTKGSRSQTGGGQCQCLPAGTTAGTQTRFCSSAAHLSTLFQEK